MYILECHERNLYTYAGGFWRACCVKQGGAPAQVRASNAWKRRERKRKSPGAVDRFRYGIF
jgi:hypothetical protein